MYSYTDTISVIQDNNLNVPSKPAMFKFAFLQVIVLKSFELATKDELQHPKASLAH